MVAPVPAESGGLAHGAEAHLAAQHLGDLRLVDRFNGHGPGIVRAGSFRAFVLAETQHHALFVGIDDINARQQPEPHHGQQHQQHRASVGHAHLGETFERIRIRPVASLAEGSTPRARFVALGFVVILVLRRPGGRILPLLSLPLFL